MQNIKTGNIVQLTKNLIQKEKKKCNVDKVKTATMSYSDRVNLSRIIQERVSSMDCDACEIAVTKHIHDLLSSGFQKVVSHDKLSLHKAVNPANDVKLIKQFNSEPKKVFELITNEIVTETHPTRRQLNDYF